MQRFVEDVSHQLKIPLSSLRLKLEARQLESGEPWIEECLAPIDRMTFLIQALLKLARLEAGSIRMTFEDSPVRLTIMKAADSLEATLSGRGQKLSIQGEEGLHLRHDARFLAEALENLIKNASEHSPKGSEITVTYERASEEGAPMVRIRVEDLGPGIPGEELPYVFDRFYRGRLSEAAGGAGIGLSLCKSIIQAHHGDIRAQNRPKAGAAFILLLPDLPGSIKEDLPS
jgi:signal transduction histidine kinase